MKPLATNMKELVEQHGQPNVDLMQQMSAQLMKGNFILDAMIFPKKPSKWRFFAYRRWIKRDKAMKLIAKSVRVRTGLPDRKWFSM